jgi:hypothetical protein
MMEEDYLNADSPTGGPTNPSLELINSALLRAQQTLPQSKYAQLLAVLEEMGTARISSIPLMLIFRDHPSALPEFAYAYA